ncbi:MAG: transketolase [Candidatus Nanopelagicales bacterium]|nr:transketolase [Candidatus Nanopelagicales bacterium]MCF8538748.1 transketolase [Candidatus Nanopelagicales bacterium]
MSTPQHQPVRQLAHPPTLDSSLQWTSADDQAISYLRALAMDAVQKVGNGHPGTAMALAPMAYLLFQRIMRHDPSDPQWLARDRFVLSAGHSSLTLYSQLFLSGYGLSMEDLASFRTAGSLTPGHPEYGHTVGVETTTGPLGQGLATAVGMAMAERYDLGLLPGAPLAHRVWVIASDGDLEEGISSEASSLAGTQQLGHLIVLWDDNRISIEGNTDVAFTEDVCARYEAYGWDVHQVDMLPTGDLDVPALYSAMVSAANNLSAPSFIRVRTTIAWPAPHAQGTAKSHGSALGSDEVAATKEALGLDPQASFVFDAILLNQLRERLAQRVAVDKAAWESDFREWATQNPDNAALLSRLQAHALPEGFDAGLPTFNGITAMATRKASGISLNAIAPAMPELWGGSADLAESNNTWIDGSPSFLPETTPTSSPSGRNIHFGIREHAMGAALNGIALDGLTRPFGGTFLVFSDYMRGSVRLSALMQTPVTYIWTHDSIGLGEDGPTHQPVEHLWSLRAIPGLSVVRPADAQETAAAWTALLQHKKPTGLILSRQDVPILTEPAPLDIREGVSRGAYILAGDPDPQVLLIATGSEVHIALQARALLAEQSVTSRVISMPCTEWFDQQSVEYRHEVLPPGIESRVAVEAGATFGWYKYVGTLGQVVGLDTFGASASASHLYEQFEITPEHVVQAALRSMSLSVSKV